MWWSLNYSQESKNIYLWRPEGEIMKSGPFRQALWEYSQYKLGNAFHQGPSEYSLYKHGNAFHHSLWEYSLWNLWNSFHQGLREYLIIHYHHNLEVCIQTIFLYLQKLSTANISMCAWDFSLSADTNVISLNY